MSREKFYITTAISYPNGKPHIGHAYETDRHRCAGALPALDGKDVFFLTGTDEHGIKMLQTARKEGISPRELADRNAAEFQRMAKALNASNDDFIRTTEEAPLRGQPGDLEGDGRQWRHLQGRLCRLVFGARRSLLRRGGDRGPRRRRALRAAGHAGRMGRGGELFLPAVGLSGQAADALREPAGLHRPGRAPQRGGELRQVRAEGPVDLAHDLRLGRSGAGRREACDVCLGRRADQLHHRGRLSRRKGRALALLAGRRRTSSARTSCASTRSTGRPS